MQERQLDSKENQATKSPQKTRSIIKILLKTFGALVVLVLALIAFLATSFGQRQLLFWADRFSSALSIDSVTGGLNEEEGLAIHNLRFQSEGLDIHLEDTTLKLPYRCFWRGQLCLDEFSLQKPNINLAFAPSESEEVQEEKSLGEFSLPLDLLLNNIQVKDLVLNINGNQIHLGELATGVEFTSTNLRLKPTKINDVLIALAEPSEEKTPAPTIGKTLPLSEKKAPQKTDWDALEERLRQPLYTLKDMTLPFTLWVEDLTAKNWLFKQSEALHDQITLETLSLVAHAKGNEVTLDKLQLKSSIATIEGQGGLTTLGDYPVDFKLTGDFPAFYKGHYFNNVNWMHLFFSQENQLDLALSGGLNQTLTLNATAKGALNLDLEASVQLTQPRMPYALKAESKKLQYPFDPKAKNPYRFETVNLSGEGDLLGYSAELTGNFVGKNTPKAPLHLKVKGDLSEVSVENLQLDVAKSHANFQGYLSWRNRLKWEAKLHLDQFDFEKYVFTNVPELKNLQGFPSVLSGDLAYNGHWDFYEGDWAMAVPKAEIAGEISHQPFALNTQLALTPKQLDLSQLDLRYHRNKITGGGQLSENADFALHIDAPNLHGLLPSLQATLFGDIQIKGQQGTAKVTGKNLHFQDFHLDKLNLDTLLNKDRQLNGQLALGLNNLRYPAGNIANLTLDLKGNEDSHQLTLSSNGQPAAADLTLTGSFSREKGIWTGELSNANLQSPVGNFKNNHHVAINVDIHHPQVDIAGHCWNNPQAELCFPRAVKLGNLGDIPFELKNINLAMLNRFMPQSQWQGVVNGAGQVQWQPNHPFSVTAQLNGKEIKLDQRLDYRTLHFHWPSLKVETALANDELNAKAQTEMLILGKNKQWQKGTVNLNLKVNDLAQKRNLSGNLGVENLSLALANQLLATDENVAGTAFADLHFGGTLQTPLLMGELGVKKVKASVKLLPFDVKNGDLVMNFNGKEATLNGTLQSPQSELKITGDANWQDLDHYRGLVRVVGEKFYLNLPLSPTQAEVKISPDVSVRVDNDSLNVSGKVDIPWANIEVKALPESGSSVSSDLVILDGPNKSENSKLLTMAKTGKTMQGRKINANLKINIGNEVNLKAYGLETHLKGDLAVNQQKGELGLYGQVHLDKGTFIAYGQNLIIRKGYIGFSGLPSKPLLNIDAIRNPTEMLDPDVTAGIRITGSAMAPRIKVYAEPSMSEDQALSYLLSGQPIDDDEGNGGAAGSALLSLTLSQTGNALSSVGQAFGIKNLNVGATGTGDNSKVAVSGNLTDRIQLRYGIGLFTGLAEFTVRLKVLPRLYLQSVSSVNQAVDLFYQFEI